LNIVYINHYAGSPAYGMEYRCHYLAREWVRSGHRVTIVAAAHSHVRSRQPAIDGRFTLQGVWVRLPPSPPLQTVIASVVKQSPTLRRDAQ
jgi:hypothetical protein